MEYSKEYIKILENGNELHIKMSAETDSTSVDIEEVLSEIALCGRNFYLAYGRGLLNDSH